MHLLRTTRTINSFSHLRGVCRNQTIFYKPIKVDIRSYCEKVEDDDRIYRDDVEVEQVSSFYEYGSTEEEEQEELVSKLPISEPRFSRSKSIHYIQEVSKSEETIIKAEELLKQQGEVWNYHLPDYVIDGLFDKYLKFNRFPKLVEISKLLVSRGYPSSCFTVTLSKLNVAQMLRFLEAVETKNNLHYRWLIQLIYHKPKLNRWFLKKLIVIIHLAKERKISLGSTVWKLHHLVARFDGEEFMTELDLYYHSIEYFNAKLKYATDKSQIKVILEEMEKHGVEPNYFTRKFSDKQLKIIINN